MTSRRQRSARGSGPDLRAEILSSARELLADTGDVAAVSIRAIGQAVGVSAPSIYRHFADKDVLIEAVCEQVFTDMDHALADAVGDERPPLDRLLSYGMEYVRFARAHPEHYRIAMMQIHAEAQALDQTLANGAFVRLTALIQECMDTGLMVAGDPLAQSLEAWACAHGIASLQISKPWLPWQDQDVAARRLLRSALAGYCLIGRDVAPPEVIAWVNGD
jgi:AcrR family transcriptional regulator